MPTTLAMFCMKFTDASLNLEGSVHAAIKTACTPPDVNTGAAIAERIPTSRDTGAISKSAITKGVLDEHDLARARGVARQRTASRGDLFGVVRFVSR